MKKSVVFWTKLNGSETLEDLTSKTELLLKKSGLFSIIKKEMLVGVKQHFGEEGSTGFIDPCLTRVAGTILKAKGSRPVLVETNTLYKGRRADTVDHLLLAHEHGFTIENTGMPICILDGIRGQNQIPVEIPGRHFSSVFIVPDLPFFDALVVLSHVKGHVLSGLGGTLKNLAMGFASRAGKLAQHADFRPEIKYGKCIRCGMCGKFCPAEALALGDNGMTVDYEKCVGCGECYAVCRSDAIGFNWGSADAAFQEKMAEHALGAVIHHRDKAIYINFFNKVSRHCDCWSGKNPPLYPDVGIFVSADPVAIDKASYDTGIKIHGKDVFRELWPDIDPTVQMSHAAAVGLGSTSYELQLVGGEQAVK